MLYYLTSSATVNLPSIASTSEIILGPKGLEEVEQQVKVLKLDLLFNPTRVWTWEALGVAYKVMFGSIGASHTILLEYIKPNHSTASNNQCHSVIFLLLEIC